MKTEEVPLLLPGFYFDCEENILLYALLSSSYIPYFYKEEETHWIENQARKYLHSSSCKGPSLSHKYRLS